MWLAGLKLAAACRLLAAVRVRRCPGRFAGRNLSHTKAAPRRLTALPVFTQWHAWRRHWQASAPASTSVWETTRQRAALRGEASMAMRGDRERTCWVRRSRRPSPAMRRAWWTSLSPRPLFRWSPCSRQSHARIRYAVHAVHGALFEGRLACVCGTGSRSASASPCSWTRSERCLTGRCS